MLSTPERIAFVLLVLICGAVAYRGVQGAAAGQPVPRLHLLRLQLLPAGQRQRPAGGLRRRLDDDRRGCGTVAGVFNLLSDLFSVLVLTGMIALLVRRFVGKAEGARVQPQRDAPRRGRPAGASGAIR